MGDVRTEALKRLAAAVRDRRLELGWTKQQSAKEAGVTVVTYRQVETAQSVRDTTYAAIERAFGWPAGACMAILDEGPVRPPESAGGEVATDSKGFVLDIEDPREVRMFAITELPEGERIWHILQMRKRDAERRRQQSRELPNAQPG